jgi:c-di-GMP-binding flagellar brake protein YcgR
MDERRKFTRFSLQLPTRIKTLSPELEKQSFDLQTYDVSAGGAFFQTAQPIPEGTRVQLRLSLESDILKVQTGRRGFIIVKGTVVRCDPSGMAICFDEDYEFGSLKRI